MVFGSDSVPDSSRSRFTYLTGAVIAIGRGFVIIVDEDKNVPRTIDTLHIVSVDDVAPNGEAASGVVNLDRQQKEEGHH